MALASELSSHSLDCKAINLDSFVAQKYLSILADKVLPLPKSSVAAGKAPGPPGTLKHEALHERGHALPPAENLSHRLDTGFTDRPPASGQMTSKNSTAKQRKGSETMQDRGERQT